MTKYTSQQKPETEVQKKKHQKKSCKLQPFSKVSFFPQKQNWTL